MVESALHQTFANAKPGQQSFVTCAKVVGVLCLQENGDPMLTAGLDTIVTRPFVYSEPICSQRTSREYNLSGTEGPRKVGHWLLQ